MTGAVLGTLRRDSGGVGQFLASAAALPDSVGPVDLAALQPAGRQIDLPSYRFERTRFWATAPTATTAGGGDGAFTAAPTELPSGQTVVTATVDRERYPWLADHVVRGAALVPATVFLSLLGEVGERIGRPVVADLTLSVPLPLPEQGAADLRIVLDPEDAAGRRALTVHARQADGGWVRHASGALAGRDPAPAEPARWSTEGATPVDVADAYRVLAERGYHYGPAFAGLHALWTRGADILAEVALPDLERGDFVTAHPALLDAALHPAVLRADAGLLVPFAWRDADLTPTDARTLRVHARPDGDDLSLTFFDGQDRPVGSVRSLTLRPLPAEERGVSLEPAWERLRATDASGPDTWVTVGASGLWDRPDFPDLESVTLPAPAIVVAPLGSAPLGPAPLGSVSGPDGDPGGDPAQAERLTLAAADLVQSWRADSRFAASRLAVVTRGALAVTDREPVRDLAASAVTGLLRSAQTEHPGTFVLIDVDDDPASLAALPQALACGEPEVALRAGRLYRPRLRIAAESRLRPPAGSRAWRLDVTVKGTLDDLALVEHPEAQAELGPREVRVEVRAAGLNFRDVTVGLGLVATEKTMGSEGAGVITEVGAEVTRFAAGDRVFGMFERSLGPLAVADERMVKPLPDGWSFAQAAGVPIVFITAYQCLVDVAGTRPGDRVLIHTATGGVGLAAIQLARHLGADVFATARADKQPTLRAWGVPDDHIASSRTLDFADAFRAVTGGRGVDVVLNSLSGKALDLSLGLLAPGGRFAEMGKTDLREVAATEAEHPGITYRAYNILGVDPDRISEVLDELVALFEAGALRHLPVRTWDVRDGQVPLRMLSRARHQGKLVLTTPRSYDPLRPTLITGGTGGLGAELARHLVTERGARHLVLLSRSGPAADGATQLSAELTAAGAEVSVVACDVADADAVAKVVAEYRPGSVFHTAGVLRDGVLTGLTPVQLRAVLRPKVAGAWHLHRLTEHLDLSAFVLFSSVAGVLGNPGQANYAAANTYLDALAQYRRARGLEATSLAWGLWRQPTGMTGHLTEADTAALARIGIAPLDSGDGMRLLFENLASSAPVRVPLRLAPEQLRPGSRAARLLEGLPDLSRNDAPSRPATPAPAPVPAAPVPVPVPAAPAPAPASAPGAAAPPAGGDLMQLVRTHTAEVLGYLEPSAVGAEDSFKELGFDSLLSVDLRNRLTAATGLRLPAGAVLEHPTPRALVNFISGLEGA
ncbi:SDR family NAD(P)-dependent oxidoreductase [Streptomyces sp. NPDC054884]